jgi:hypothetical protein
VLREYSVNVPVAGYASIQVAANNEAEAKSKALEKHILLNNVIELVACEEIRRRNNFNTPSNIINRRCTVAAEMDSDNIEVRCELVEYMEYINAVDREL